MVLTLESMAMGPQHGMAGGTAPPAAAGAGTVVQMLTLGSALQAASFERFARTRYLAELEQEARRTGSGRRVRLMRRRPIPGMGAMRADNQFLLIVDNAPAGERLPGENDPVLRDLLAAYAPVVEPIGCFEPVSATSGDDAR